MSSRFTPFPVRRCSTPRERSCCGRASAAQPGEFTLRAFLAGKLDLPRAEAVLGVIEAATATSCGKRLTSSPAASLSRCTASATTCSTCSPTSKPASILPRKTFISSRPKNCSTGSAAASRSLTLLQKQLEQRSLSGRPFRVVLAGEPNAGKSSLFNAPRRWSALWSVRQPGTTRDYLTKRSRPDGMAVELVDTAGWQDAVHDMDPQAQMLGQNRANWPTCCCSAWRPVGRRTRRSRRCCRSRRRAAWRPSATLRSRGRD